MKNYLEDDIGKEALVALGKQTLRLTRAGISEIDEILFHPQLSNLSRLELLDAPRDYLKRIQQLQLHGLKALKIVVKEEK